MNRPFDKRLYDDSAATVQGGTGTGTAEPTTTTAPDATVAPVAPPAAPNDYVDMKDQMFHFKKEKDTKDPEGNVLQKGEKHPSVKMYLPVPKLSRLAEFLTDPAKYAKEIELLNAAIFDVVYGQARAQVNEFREKNPKDTVTNAVLNYDQLDWTAIANLPKSERGAYAPDEDELNAFLESYERVMPAAANKKPEAIANHVKLFKDGFKKQRGQKDILELFAGMLELWSRSAPEADVEENAQVAEYFINKLGRWLKTEEKITMDML